ncbi:MAG: 3'(2'),5'-bisphosphate nucleotidase CysQ [Proteobacteria bacterium]|nr:3'(2'),5'-bisphosphate nucleotidase CysQ [Pseudomonadota bacterium]
MISKDNFAPLLEGLIPVAVEAGAAIMEIFYQEDQGLSHKQDKSPVTRADEKAEEIILAALEKLAPGVQVVAEERAYRDGIPRHTGEEFFLVDPLDGTKEFLNKRDAFTVNIALIQKGRAVLGLVYAPARDALYYGDRDNGAYLIQKAGAPRPLKVRQADPSRLTIVASLSHRNRETDDYLENYPGAELTSIGSSLKFCLVAEGKADLYPRLGPTMEWDTAAGQAVLEAAGGSVLNPDGSRFLYHKPEFRNGYFIALGDQSLEFVKF